MTWKMSISRLLLSKLKVIFYLYVLNNAVIDSWGKLMFYYNVALSLFWSNLTMTISIIYLNGFLFVNKHEVRQWLRKWWEQWWSQKCSSQKWWWWWWRLQWFWRTRCRWWRQDFFETMRKLGSLKKSKSEQNQDDVI